jgi:nicotinamidase-related amidase
LGGSSSNFHTWARRAFRNLIYFHEVDKGGHFAAWEEPQLFAEEIRAVIGLIAHTCVEATVRYAVELGYEVTVVKDATSDYSDEEMHAALDVNIPNYASAIVTTNEIVDSISSLS